MSPRYKRLRLRREVLLFLPLALLSLDEPAVVVPAYLALGAINLFLSRADDRAVAFTELLDSDHYVLLMMMPPAAAYSIHFMVSLEK